MKVESQIPKLSLLEFSLIFLIIFTPLAFGAVHFWAFTLMEVLILFLLLTHLFSPSPFSSSFWGLRFTLPFLLFFALILFQIIPLPTSLVKTLSPKTAELYQQAFPTPLPLALTSSPYNPLAFYPPSRESSDLLPPPPTSHPLSIYPHATKTELIKFLGYFAGFFLILTTFTTFAQIKRLVFTIIFTGTGVALLGILQFLSHSDKIYGFWQSQYKQGTYGGPFVNENHFAGYLAMVIPLAIALLIIRPRPPLPPRAKTWKQRISVLDAWIAQNALLLFLIAIMAIGIFLSLSRGGIISFLISLFLFFSLLGLKKYSRQKRKSILLISGLILALLIWLGIGPVIQELSTLLDLKKAASARPQVWKDTILLCRDFPWFGVGLGNFQNLYPQYTTLTSSTFWEHTHNDYLELLADTGIIGTVFWLGGILAFLLAIIKKWKKRRDPWVVNLTLGGIISVFALLLHCAVEFNFHIPANAFLFFVILGIIGVTVNLRRTAEDQNSPSPFLPNPPHPFVLWASRIIVGLFLLITIKDALAHFLASCPHPTRLKVAIFLDPGNADYHFAQGNYYLQKMAEAWKQSKWKLDQGKWILQPEKNTVNYGINALQSFQNAVRLSPTNAWYFFYWGWTIEKLQRLSRDTALQIYGIERLPAEKIFSRARILAPNNPEIKKYLNPFNQP